MLSHIIKYVCHLLISRHLKGRGIHSPYLFSFISEAVYESARSPAQTELLRWHRKIFMNRERMEVMDAGAGSAVNRSGSRRIGSMARWSSVSRRNGRLLFRIARWYQPDIILELGTGLGISTAWLARGCPAAGVISIEGSPQKARFAIEQMRLLEINNVKVIAGNFDEMLSDLGSGADKRVLVFLDGNHRYEPTIRYLNHFIESKSKEMLIVLDDIHWSGEMERAWREVREMQGVRVTLDMFFMGLVFTREGLNKQNFLLRW